VFTGDGGYDAGEASHTVLLELRRTITRHPGVSGARGDPPDLFTAVHGDVDPRVFGGASEKGSLSVRWFTGASREDRPQFSFHYSEDTGFDCGWHHEPNPHVEGWAHYQGRESAAASYEYQPVEFASLQPVRVMWGVLERLEDVLSAQ